MVDIDGTDSFKGNSMTDDIDKVVIWTGTALPVGAANKVPKDGKFLFLDSLSAPTTATWYIQTSATLSSPNFVEIPDTSGLDQLGYIVLSTTIADYTNGASAVSSSNGNYAEDFKFIANTTEGDSQYPTTDTGVARVNPSTDVIDFVIKRDGSNDLIYHDFGASVVSNTAWRVKFKMHFGTLATSMDWFCGMSTTTGGSNQSQDWIGFRLNSTATDMVWYVSDGEATAPQALTADNSTSETRANDVDRWFVFERLTSTTYQLKIFSDEAETTQVGSTVSGTCASTNDNHRYFKWMNIETNPLGGTTTCTIDDIETNIPVTASYLIAGKRWLSTSEANPRIYLDLTSDREIVATALAIDKTLTTVTSLKIRASTDTTFTDSENIVYVNVSDFTDDTWRFLVNNFIATNRRYLQIYANETGVLALRGFKPRYGLSSDLKILTHRHKTRDISQADSFLDSN